MKRSLATALALTASGALFLSPLAANGTSAKTAASAKTTTTRFAFGTSGYATRLVGGQLPAGSDKTAFQVIGCTNQAGLSKTNTEVGVQPGGFSLKAASTHVWTTHQGTHASAWATNRIVSVALGRNTLGVLRVNGIVTKTHAYWDGRYRARASVTVASVTLAGVSLGVPTPSKPIVVTGVATISVATGTRTVTGHSAAIQTTALKVHLDATNSTLYIGHARSTIFRGSPVGLFGGSAYSTKASVAQGVITSGATPLLVMPCQGTYGITRYRSVAHAVIKSGVNARGLETSERAYVKGTHAAMFTDGKIARLSLGGGRLVIKAVEARARAFYTRGGKVHTDLKGTTLGIIRVNGQRVSFPPSNVIRVPGVATVQPRVVKRTRDSISVTCLRVTLLDGSLAVINLGHARARIHPTS